MRLKLCVVLEFQMNFDTDWEWLLYQIESFYTTQLLALREQNLPMIGEFLPRSQYELLQWRHNERNACQITNVSIVCSGAD